MNLTYRDFSFIKTTIGKLLGSNIIQNFEDALLIADIKEPFNAVDTKYVSAINTIAYKYGKLSEKRISDKYPKGYNSVKEVETEVAEKEVFLNKTDTASFDFKPLTTATIQLLFDGTPEIIEIEKDGKKVKKETGVKLNNINADDIAVLNKLGLRDTSKEKKIEGGK